MFGRERGGSGAYTRARLIKRPDLRRVYTFAARFATPRRDSPVIPRFDDRLESRSTSPSIDLRLTSSPLKLNGPDRALGGRVAADGPFLD